MLHRDASFPISDLLTQNICGQKIEVLSLEHVLYNFINLRVTKSEQRLEHRKALCT